MTHYTHCTKNDQWNLRIPWTKQSLAGISSRLQRDWNPCAAFSIGLWSSNSESLVVRLNSEVSITGRRGSEPYTEEKLNTCIKALTFGLYYANPWKMNCYEYKQLSIKCSQKALSIKSRMETSRGYFIPGYFSHTTWQDFSKSEEPLFWKWER